MSLSIGDAVLTFLGDTTQLDQVFARIPIETEAAMLKAAGSVGAAGTAAQQLSFELDATGENAAFAGGMISEAAEVSAHTIREAKAEAHLLGDMFGIHLPRHVRGFIVELPGVATALSAAFAATAVIFIIEALVKGIEKIVEFAHAAEKIQEVMDASDKVVRHLFEGLDNDLLKSEIRFDELTGNHVEAFRKKLELINNTSLSKLESELEKIKVEADKVFIALDRNWFSKLLGLEGSADVKKNFDEIGAAVEKALATRTPEAYAAALKMVDAQLVKTETDLTAFQKKQGDSIRQLESALSGRAGIANIPFGADPNTQRALQEAILRLNQYRGAIEEVQKTEQKDVDNAKIEAQKRAADALRKIEDEREKGLDRRMKAEANYAKEQEKQHDKIIKDAEREKDELNAANIAIANVQLAQFHRMAEGARAWIDGEMNQVQAAAQRKADLLKLQFDTGIISGQKYLDEIKKLYNAEAQALINLLNQKQQLVILEAQKEAAARGQIMTVAEAKELKGFIDLENQKKAVIDKSMTAIDKEVQKITTHAAKARPTWDKFFDDIIKGSTKSGAALKTLGALTAQAIGESVAAAVMGSQSFGAAMMQMLRSLLAMLAGKAVVKALEEIAEGFSALANPFTAAQAPLHFHAAAMWGVVAGAAGAAGAALGAIGGGSGAGGGGDHPQIDKDNPNTQTKSNAPPGGKNVPHLAGGGLLTADTLAVVHRNEAVIPLGDPSAISAIADVLSQHLDRGGGGNHFYLQPKGMVSADTLGKLAKKMSRQVQTGRARLMASNSHKVTRRA